MPILKSAFKKLRKDKKRTKTNRKRREMLKKHIKEATKSELNSKIVKAISFVDKMAKVHLIHKNKASRLKSRLSKIVKVDKNKPSRKTKRPPKKAPKSL